jgi:hypothetical protein
MVRIFHNAVIIYASNDTRVGFDSSSRAATANRVTYNSDFGAIQGNVQTWYQGCCESLVGQLSEDKGDITDDGRDVCGKEGRVRDIVGSIAWEGVEVPLSDVSAVGEFDNDGVVGIINSYDCEAIACD